MIVRRCLATAAVTIALLITTLSPRTGAGRAAPSAGAGEPITIGLIVERTGSGAASGILTIEGATLATSQVNAAGGINGRPLRLVTVDDQSSNAGAGAAFQRLMRRGDIVAVIGPIRSTQVQAITPSIERQGIPVVIGGTAPSLTHEGNPWVFRTRPNDGYSARAMAQFVVHTLHVRNVAVVHSSDAFGAGGNSALRAALASLGVVPAADQSYDNHATDLTAQALAIKASGATALLAYTTYDQDTVLLARQLHQIGDTATWVGSATSTDLEVRKLGGSLFQGSYGVTDFTVGQNRQSVSFNQTMVAKYHVQADIFSAYGFDAVHLLAGVLRNDGIQPDAIRRGLLAIRGYQGVEGTYNFDANGDGVHQYTIVRNQRGALHTIAVMSF